MYFNLFFGMEAKKPPFREALKLASIIEQVRRSGKGTRCRRSAESSRLAFRSSYRRSYR